jgi:hypothetical protein
LFLGLLVYLLAYPAPPARADLITFDDVPKNYNYYEPIPNGYHGLSWNNFWAFPTGGAYLSAGYKGAVSLPNAGENVGSLPASLSSPTPFTLNSGYFMAAFRDGVQLEVVGSLRGVTQYDMSFTINTSGPKLLTFSNAMVDQVVFIPSGGHDVYPYTYRGDGEDFVVDNLSITASPTPEPSSLILLVVGAASTGLAAWRRTRRSGTAAGRRGWRLTDPHERTSPPELPAVIARPE